MIDWSKYEHFTAAEFVCHCCGRGEDEMSPDLLTALQTARYVADVPFKINSGFRCPAHNAAVGGVPDSAHTLGMAADVATPSSLTRWAVLHSVFGRFVRLGVYQTFVHVDVDKSKPSPVCWVGK